MKIGIIGKIKAKKQEQSLTLLLFLYIATALSDLNEDKEFSDKQCS